MWISPTTYVGMAPLPAISSASGRSPVCRKPPRRRNRLDPEGRREEWQEFWVNLGKKPITGSA
jgi:hypothetical protein